MRSMPHAPTEARRRRHQTVRDAFTAHDLDALIVVSRPNILYLTNFSGSSAIVVLTRDRVYFITDFRYVTAIEEMQRSARACPDLELVTVETTYDATLAKLLGSIGGRRIGFESAHLTVSRYNWLVSALKNDSGPPPELVPIEQIVERARVRKDAYEVETLREAARRLSEVAVAMVDEIRRGRTERDIALAIDWRMLKAGFERPAFDTIVASGPNAALPHAHPGQRILTEGDLVVLDFGGVYDSYCVDLTRTVSVGAASGRAREVYTAVLAAHGAAIAAVRPGASRFAIDAAARDTLHARGFGEAFGHGTGHGLGVEVHEDPRITKRRGDGDTGDEPVEPGMVFTIEPGVYLSGWGGVRIEDDVLVTDRGVEVLTRVPTELMEL